MQPIFPPQGQVKDCGFSTEKAYPPWYKSWAGQLYTLLTLPHFHKIHKDCYHSKGYYSCDLKNFILSMHPSRYLLVGTSQFWHCCYSPSHAPSCNMSLQWDSCPALALSLGRVTKEESGLSLILSWECHHIFKSFWATQTFFNNVNISSPWLWEVLPFLWVLLSIFHQYFVIITGQIFYFFCIFIPRLLCGC